MKERNDKATRVIRKNSKEKEVKEKELVMQRGREEGMRRRSNRDSGAKNMMR